MRERFWERFTLEELTPQEWEALCDGCGQCCLLKLHDEDTQELAVLNVACRLSEMLLRRRDIETLVMQDLAGQPLSWPTGWRGECLNDALAQALEERPS